MRRISIAMLLLLAATTLTWSQSLQQTLMEISNDLTRISEQFDGDLQTLEAQLLSLRETSTELSKQLDDLEPRVESSEESQADLQSSLTRYRTYAQESLEAQAKEIRRLQTEIWVYRIGGVVIAGLTGWIAIRVLTR